MLLDDVNTIFKDVRTVAPTTIAEVIESIFDIAIEYAEDEKAEILERRKASHLKSASDPVLGVFSSHESAATNALMAALDETVFNEKAVYDPDHMKVLCHDYNIAVIMQYITSMVDIHRSSLVISTLFMELMDTYLQRVRRGLEVHTVRGFVEYIQNKLKYGQQVQVTITAKPIRVPRR